MLVLLTAGRFKEKKENPKTNKIKKIGEQTKHKTREKLVGHTYQPQWHPTSSLKQQRFLKKKKKSNAMFHSLFIHQGFHETVCSTNETSVPQEIPSRTLKYVF